MNIRAYIIGLLAVAALAVGCSESLEDTYDEWVGDGKIRYVAKCSNVAITPGWERLNVSWKNGTDASVEHIKVKWSATGVLDSVLLAATDTTYDIRNLADGSYRVDLSAIATDGSESLSVTNYGRPYTDAHEVVKTFTQGIVKYYRLEDLNTLVYWADIYDETNVFEMRLHYIGTDGEQHEASVWKEEPEGFLDMDYYAQFTEQTLHSLDGIDFSKDSSIYITRLGLLEDCPDTIRFEPIVLGNTRAFTSDFKTAIERRYGYSDQTESDLVDFNAFIDTVRVLEFDYEMSSFEDVLYCPNLEKIVLGKNRYLNPDYPSSSVLYDEDRSTTVLDKANELRGLTIERYANHYFEDAPDYLTEMGYPELPTNLDYIPLTTVSVDTITCSVPEIVGHDSHFDDYLFDNDPATNWKPLQQPDSRTYEITVELKEAIHIDGFKVRQSGDANSQNYFPNQITLQVSKDQVTWTNATYVFENLLGQGVGEVTLLPLAEPGEYRYFRLTVTDQTYVNLSGIELADIVPYVEK